MPFITLPHIRLHYLDEGAGPPLVWLPGGNDSAALMLHAHRRLTSRVRLICYDPRGQGESDTRHTPEDYAPERHVEDLTGFLDALGLDRVMLGGHSRGGRTSVEFALRHPERVVGVVAAGSPLLGSTAQRSGGFRHYQQVLRDEGVDAFLAQLRSAPRHPERLAQWRAAAHRAGPEALAAQYEALSRLGPLTERLRELTVPALFLTGDRDFLAEHTRTAAGATKLITLAVISDAGHALFRDNPAGYFAVLNSFLDSLAYGVPRTVPD